MAVNKNFVVKNGLEVNTKLILADANTNKVGIGSTAPRFELDVAGGIGATNSYVTGISTIVSELNVGTDGSVLTVLGVGGSVGVGTALPGYLLDVRAPVSTGQTALYVQGDVRVTGDLSVDDITFDQANINNLNVTGISTISQLNVTGISTFNNYVDINNSVDISGSVNIGGITTITNTTDSTTFNNGALVIDGGLGVEKSVNIGGDLDVGGNITIGGSFFSLESQEVLISNKDIILGYTTVTNPNDDSANHAGIAIASTEGSPLVSFSASGINTLPDTYKQLMWFRSGTLGFSTDMFGFNYGVAIGTTTVANGIRLAVGSGVRITDTTINTNNINISGASTLTGYVDVNNSVDISNNLNVVGVSTLGKVLINSGIVTASSGIITYYGDGQYLDLKNSPYTGIGIGTTAGVVGYGITFLDLKGAGVSTTQYNASTGIATIFFEGGGSGSIPGDGTVTPVKLSTGGPSWNTNGDVLVSGITTISNASGTVRIGIGTTALLVEGNARVTGILTVGSSSITLDGNTNQINGVTIQSGIITAISFSGDGSGLTGAGSTVSDDTSTNSTFYPLFTSTTSGTVTASKVSTTKLSFNPSTGTLSATALSGVGSLLTSLNASNISSGIVSTARLASGTANSGTYLRGDSTWAALTAPNNGTLTLNVSGTGLSGSQTFTADQASNATFTVTSNATSANTVSAIVARDASGNFSAGTITASLSGNSSTATTLQTARSINGVSFNGSADITVNPTSGAFSNGQGAKVIQSGGTASGGSSGDIYYIY